MTKRPAAGHGLDKFAAPFAKRPKVEGEQSSWPKYIKTVHLVFSESFNGRQERLTNKKSAHIFLQKSDVMEND